MNIRMLAIAAGTSLFSAGSVHAAISGPEAGEWPWPGVSVFVEDLDGWLGVVGEVNHITFTEHGPGQVTDQYAAQGLTIDPTQNVWHSQSSTYHDGWGISSAGPFGVTFYDFDAPRQALAYLSPGSLLIDFYLDGVEQGSIVSFAGDFLGLVTDFEFDSIGIIGSARPIDDLWIPVVPGPGALALGGLPLLLPGFGRGGRRRRR